MTASWYVGGRRRRLSVAGRRRDRERAWGHREEGAPIASRTQARTFARGLPWKHEPRFAVVRFFGRKRGFFPRRAIVQREIDHDEMARNGRPIRFSDIPASDQMAACLYRRGKRVAQCEGPSRIEDVEACVGMGDGGVSAPVVADREPEVQ